MLGNLPHRLAGLDTGTLLRCLAALPLLLFGSLSLLCALQFPAAEFPHGRLPAAAVGLLFLLFGGLLAADDRLQRWRFPLLGLPLLGTPLLAFLLPYAPDPRDLDGQQLLALGVPLALGAWFLWRGRRGAASAAPLAGALALTVVGVAVGGGALIATRFTAMVDPGPPPELPGPGAVMFVLSQPSYTLGVDHHVQLHFGQPLPRLDRHGRAWWLASVAPEDSPPETRSHSGAVAPADAQKWLPVPRPAGRYEARLEAVLADGTKRLVQTAPFTVQEAPERASRQSAEGR